MKNNKIVKGNLRKTESHSSLITPSFQQELLMKLGFNKNGLQIMFQRY